MSATGSRLSTLPDIGALLEVLLDDERPSLIVELNAFGTLPAQVVFRNAALTNLITKSGAKSSLEDWVDSSAVQILQGVKGSIPFCGRYWSSKRFRETWRIVSCGADAQRDPRTPGRLITEQRTELTLTEETVDMFPGLLSPFQAVELSSQPRRSSENLADWTISEPQSPWLRFIKDYPWDQTRFGAMRTWSPELRRLAINIMNRSEPRILLWGSERLVMYNEAFANMVRRNHPSSLGIRFSEIKTSSSIYNSLSDMLKDSFGQGKSTKFSNLEWLVERNGFFEQTYWGCSLLPQSGNNGSLDSAIVELTEVTETVLQDQRRAQSEDIFRSVSKAEDLPQLWSNLLGTLEHNALDISYAMIYTALDQSRTTQTNGLPTPADDLVTTPSTESECFSFTNQFQLADSIGLSENAFSQVVNIAAAETTSGRSLADVLREAQSTQEVVVVHNASLPQELSLENPQVGSVRSACVLPVLDLNGRSLAFVILGMNPRRPYTDHSNRLVFYIRETICKYAILLTLPEEQRLFQKKFEDATMGLSHQLRLSILKAKKKEERFLRIAKSAPLGMYLYLPKEKAFHVNEAYLRMTGVTKESLQADLQSGFPWLQTISEEYVDVAVNEWQKVMIKKTPSALEYKIRCSPEEPQPRYVSATSFPDLDEHGDVVLIHGWLIDISDRKCKESLLAQKLEVALENKQATEHFLDMVSHEMRNPLSAIFQSTDAILEATKQYTSIPDLPAACVENLRIVEDAAQTIALCAHHQKSIFDDILTVSKLDSGLLTIMPEEVRPTEVVEKALKMYDQEARRSDIKTSVEIEDSYREHISDTVMVDPSRLLQIIINLLQNAIKCTQSSEERHITISLGALDREPTDEDQQIDLMPLSPRKTSSPLGLNCEHEDRFSAAFRSEDSAEQIYLYCTVEDTGSGLSENEKRMLFKRFSEPMTYKQYGGSGLGLYLSKELVELQGGRIGLRSQEDVGTSFGFYVRCRRVGGKAASRPVSQSAYHAFAPPDSPMSPHPKGHRPRMSRTEAFPSKKVAEARERASDGNLHVLVVEDNLINQKVMAKQLRNLGCIVHVANHGVDALRFVAGSSVSLASTSGNDIPLDIILMDIEMPLMNGLEAMRRIREMQSSGLLTKHIPTIAVTANARSEQQRAAIEAGMDDVVTKPFRIPDLMCQMKALVEAQ